MACAVSGLNSSLIFLLTAAGNASLLLKVSLYVTKSLSLLTIANNSLSAGESCMHAASSSVNNNKQIVFIYFKVKVDSISFNPGSSFARSSSKIWLITMNEVFFPE